MLFRSAYLVFPEIGYAVNIRPGDLLFVNNMAGLHGNTELVLNDDKAERVSMIAFFHENLMELGSYDYEDTRRQFVESRMYNKEHPLWWDKWNGVSPGMWADGPSKTGDYTPAREWYDYLKAKPEGDAWLNKHHPWLKESFESAGLEEFFG